MARFDPARDRCPRRGRATGGLLRGALVFLVLTASRGLGAALQETSGPASPSPGELAAAAETAMAAGDRTQALGLADQGLEATEGEAGWQAFFLLRRAEFSKGVALEEPLADLERAEELIRAHLGEHVYYEELLCHVFGGRGEVFREWGVLDRAGIWFARERAAVDALVERGESVEKERLAANAHGVNQALALDDGDALEAAVEAALADEELYDLVPLERIKILLRYGRGLFEAELVDPHRGARAEGVLSRALAELELLAGSPEAMPASECFRPVLTLARIALRSGEPATARLRLAEADRIAGRFSGEHPTEEALLAALHARVEGNPARHLAPLAAAFGRLVESWKRAPARAGGTGFLQYGAARSALSRWITLELRAHPGAQGVRAAFSHVLTCQDLGSLSRKLGGREVDLARVRTELLGPRDGFLLFLPATDATHLFLVDREEVGHLSLASIDRILPVLRRLVRSLQGPAAALPDGPLRWRRVAEREESRRELGDLLLPDSVVARMQSWRIVSVVGLDLFGEVPLEILPAGEHPYLGTWKAVARMPNLSVGLALVERAKERSAATQRHGVVLLAAPRNPAATEAFGVDLPSLGTAPDAYERLVDAYGPGESHVWLGAEATAEKLGAPAVRSSEVLQFFTHGVQEFERERPAALVLAPSPSDPDGLLHAEEVETVASPPIVLATACRTGAGPSRRGDAGASDLGGAFLAAGAEAVLLSSFDLEVTAARRLSRVFHREWVRGAPAAEALRIARAELAEDPDFADPFLFGLFWLVGQGGAVTGAGGDGSRLESREDSRF